jgi:hypothetical protein
MISECLAAFREGVSPSQRDLEFLKLVILNSFQDLTSWTKRDAESILNQVQHKVQKHDTISLQMLEINSQTFCVSI